MSCDFEDVDNFMAEIVHSAKINHELSNNDEFQKKLKELEIEYVHVSPAPGTSSEDIARELLSFLEDFYDEEGNKKFTQVYPSTEDDPRTIDEHLAGISLESKKL